MPCAPMCSHVSVRLVPSRAQSCLGSRQPAPRVGGGACGREGPAGLRPAAGPQALPPPSVGGWAVDRWGPEARIGQRFAAAYWIRSEHHLVFFADSCMAFVFLSLLYLHGSACECKGQACQQSDVNRSAHDHT